MARQLRDLGEAMARSNKLSLPGTTLHRYRCPMSWVTLWKFLHIASMFGAVAVIVGGGIVSNQVQKGRDVRAIRNVIAAENSVAPVAGILMVLGIIFGFVTAAASGFDLLAPWLLITYGLILAIILVGALYHGVTARSLKKPPRTAPKASLPASSSV
jgi:Na+/alanine symporter